MNWLYQKLKSEFKRRLIDTSDINVTRKSVIHESVKIKNSRVRGKVNLAQKVVLQEGVLINSESEINIAKHSIVNGPNTDFYCAINKINIGAFCSIARNVSFQEFSHYTNSVTTFLIRKHIFKEKNKDIYSKGDINIGNDVWIGAHSIVLSGINVGNGAVIGSNSVVNKDVEDYAIVAGSPAKTIGYRFSPEIISKLKELQWWNWEEEKIQKNNLFFEGELTLDKFKSIV